ncbi:MAG: hypothetical protein F6J98_27100 [Moorea sp. SIO4G2]|nr:hypothetical protein [Moorena sp. SIO4G2]
MRYLKRVVRTAWPNAPRVAKGQGQSLCHPRYANNSQLSYCTKTTSKHWFVSIQLSSISYQLSAKSLGLWPRMQSASRGNPMFLCCIAT